MSLEDMQKLAKEHGIGAREWCKMAGMKWQSYYRKKKNERLVKLHEYDALYEALTKITGEKHHEDSRRREAPAEKPQQVRHPH